MTLRATSVRRRWRPDVNVKMKEYVHPGEEIEDKPTKEEFKVAKWMKKNVPIKKTKFLNHNVEYFTGTRAVDALLTSPFATSEDSGVAGGLFATREEVCDYLHVMLTHKFFHRARKVPVDENELKARKGKKKTIEKKAEGSANEEEKEKKDKGTDGESNAATATEGGKEQQVEKEKRKKKIRLEMHDDQRFVDSLDAYVWIFDPIPFYYWIIGTLLVLGAICVCLFPLWPPSVRLGVYYLSVLAATFLVSIIILAVLRVIIFSIIWILTMGKHHLWILPNLTEDVGFFASFWPLYTYEYKGETTSSKKKSKKKKKDKDSDAEEEDEKQDHKSEEKGKLVEDHPSGNIE
ncbi:unnamed protein product [Acanthoscelides obtectus]|uniref:Translocation protein SEC62 n=1 Tax=Acanthoscelides obtectus TaxID=200917 RepID=A0A9P0P347_ACAOB|nr:unnamed protein product [Acanthoscelides obtectus]CAK1669888.1 Translocation protein SEC62 [Acanthoscelides obtectus]